MNALEPYNKKSAPGHADLLRKFGPSEEEEDQHLRRLVITMDLTLTDMTKPPQYRANQAAVFIAFNNERIATLFEYARIISFDALPRENKSSGTFENNMRVWVREDDIDKAVTLMEKQRWVAKVEPECTHIVRAADNERIRSSGVTHRPSQSAVHLSLSAG